jgi:hypothetical protein
MIIGSRAILKSSDPKNLSLNSEIELPKSDIHTHICIYADPATYQRTI